MFEPMQGNPYPDTHTFGEGPDPHPLITFSHDGRPFLRYEARAWLIDRSGNPVRPAGRRARVTDGPQ